MAVLTRFISCRETRSGDWLIFEAVPYKLGIGVEKVGSKGSGYTTGYQFGRAGSAPEAIAAAEAIVAEKSDEFCHWALIEWCPPAAKNSQFVDLPRLFPSGTKYDSKTEAEVAGWIYINPAKTIEWYRGRVIKCIDVSPDNSFGYDFAIKIRGEEMEFATSEEVRIGQRTSTRFRSGEVVAGILTARQWIDEDLISLTAAAALMGKSVQAVSQQVVRDSLTGYTNPSAQGARQGAKSVSRAELQRLGFIQEKTGRCKNEIPGHKDR